LGACQAPVIIIIALRLSENTLPPCAGRTSGLDGSANLAGAPHGSSCVRGSAGAAVTSREQELELRISYGYIAGVVSLQTVPCRRQSWPKRPMCVRPETSKGHPVSPGWPFRNGDVVHVIRLEGSHGRRDRTAGLRAILHSHKRYARLASRFWNR
jgi:hypothetical protein